jgi:hypothetical protein
VSTDIGITTNTAPEEPVLKQQIISTVAAVLLFATAAQATTMSSPNFTSNAGRIVGGGTASTDVSGMSKTGIAIGQALFIQAGGSSNHNWLK